MEPITMIVATCLIVGGVSPMAIDGIAGEQIGADHLLYGMERLGEDMNGFIFGYNKTERARERLQELEQLEGNNTERQQEMLQEANQALEQVRNEISENATAYQNLITERNRIITQKGLS